MMVSTVRWLAMAGMVLGAWATTTAPDTYTIAFETDVGPYTSTINVTIIRDWAPIGADHLYELVSDGFYDDASFFRVVPDFVVQFGIAGDPAANRKWSTTILDDPVLHSNVAGTLVYATAGQNTRTTQLFFNTVNNAGLDDQGFAPLGTLDAASLAVAKQIYNPTPGNSNGVNQEEYTMRGSQWIHKKYSSINSITKASIRP